MWTTTTLNSEGLGKESSMAGHFPPNSRVTGVKCFAAADITKLPTRELPENFRTSFTANLIWREKFLNRGLVWKIIPVKKILSHFCCSSCSQTFGPPWITLMALESKYWGMILARKEEQTGACSEGFMTTTFPADIAPINGSNDSTAYG